MPSVAAVARHNAGINLANKRFLVVGGTAGIGRATAIKLASLQASVTIAGRNATAGSEIVAQLSSLNPTGAHEFHRVDMTSLKDIRRFATEFRNRHNTLHGTVISAGFMSMSGRTESEDGIDKKFQVHYYGRVALIRELLPLVKRTARGGEEDVRVMSVLAAGYGNTVDLDDLDLKKGYGIKAVADAASGYNDLAVNALSLENPSISFIHIAPGAIDTSLVDNLPWYFSKPAKLLGPLFLTKPETCAEFMACALTADEYKKGWHLLSSKAEEIKPVAKYHTEQNVKRVWEHTLGLIEEK
ncbi:FabG domain-containing protein [Fimicolochytrium jonesii]|uniref:FabG domain-containing protein n=1 Tax=Fimicolochytrium jonesii TaxID=1396493 RepID=UPI0022FF22BE|nr:FabG domain-containing protein [Fimicolochytrium jonesii]KAI8817424.1 FabG domain-containing protein [Fimicolochytrium jonesii]